MQHVLIIIVNLEIVIAQKIIVTTYISPIVLR